MGSGKWLLESQDSDTVVTFYWDLGTTNPIMNLTGKLPSVKTWMQNNHDKVMSNGYQVLKAKLGDYPFNEYQSLFSNGQRCN